MSDNIAVKLIKDKHKRVINAFRARGFEYADNEWSREVGAWKVFTDSRNGTEFLNPNNPLSDAQSFKRYWLVGVSPLDSKSLIKNTGMNFSAIEELYGESLVDMVEYGDGNDPDTVLNFNFPAGAKVKVQDRAEILDAIRTALEDSDEVSVAELRDNSRSIAAGRKPTDLPGRGMRIDRMYSVLTLSAFAMGNGANKLGDAQRDILKRIVNSSKTFSIYYRDRSGFNLPGEKYKHEAIDDFMRLAERYVADMPDEELYLHLPAGLLPAGDAVRLLTRLDNDVAQEAASVIRRLSNFTSASLEEAQALAKQKDIASDTFDDEDAVNRVISELDLSELEAAGDLIVDSFVPQAAYKRLASFDGTANDFRDVLVEQIESLESVAKLQMDVRRAIMFAQEELPARREQISESLAEVMYGQKDTFTEGVFDDYIDDATVSDEVYDVVSDYALECFDACKKKLTDRVDKFFNDPDADTIITYGSQLEMNPDELLSDYDSSNEDLFSGFESFEDSIQLPYKPIDEDAVHEQMLADAREVMPSGQHTEQNNGVRLRKQCSFSEARDIASKIRDHERLGRVSAQYTDLRLNVDSDSLRGLDRKKIAKLCTERFSKEFDGMEFYMTCD